MDCNLPGSSVHGISQARVLEWVAIFSSRGSSRPRDGTHGLLCLLHWQIGSLLLSHWGSPSAPKSSDLLGVGDFGICPELSFCQTPWGGAGRGTPSPAEWRLCPLPVGTAGTISYLPRDSSSLTLPCQRTSPGSVLSLHLLGCYHKCSKAFSSFFKLKSYFY